MLKKSLVYAALTFAFCTFFDQGMVNGMDSDGSSDESVPDGTVVPKVKKAKKPKKASVVNSVSTGPASGDASSFPSDLNTPDWVGLKTKLAKKINKFSTLPGSSDPNSVKAFAKQITGDTDFFLYVLKTYTPQVNQPIVTLFYQLFSGNKKSKKSFLAALGKSFQYTNGQWVQPNVSINGKNITLFNQEDLANVAQKQLSKFLSKNLQGIFKDLKTFYIKALKINQVSKLISSLNAFDAVSLSTAINNLEVFSEKDAGATVVGRSSRPVVQAPTTTQTAAVTSMITSSSSGGVSSSGSMAAPQLQSSSSVAPQTSLSIDPILGLPINNRNQNLIAQALAGVNPPDAVRIHQLLRNWNIIIPRGTVGVKPQYTMTSYDQAYLVGALTRLAGNLDEKTLEFYLKALISSSPESVYIFNNRERIIERFTQALIQNFQRIYAASAQVSPTASIASPMVTTPQSMVSYYAPVAGPQ